LVDLQGQTIIPGLVNAHYHSYGNAVRGTENSLPLEPWALFTVAYGRSLDDRGIQLAVLLGAAEMMRAGITACIDHFAHAVRVDAALDAHRQSGMRVGFAPMLHDRYDHDIMDIALPADLRLRVEGPKRPDAAWMVGLFRRLQRQWHGRDGRISLLLGPNAPQRCTPELWETWRLLARELDLSSHTHLLETRAQAGIGLKHYKGMVARMAQAGLLNDRLSVAHAIWTTEAERALLADHGVTVVHNPASNLMIGSGTAPIADYRRRGVSMALGSDAANTGGRHDLFEVVRLAMMLPRPSLESPEHWPAPHEALGWATAGGMRALGEPGGGRLAVDQHADIAVLDLRGAGEAALAPNLSALVQHASPACVRATMVGGRWVYRDGKVLSFDERGVIDEFAELRERLLARSEEEVKTAIEATKYFSGLANRC
jgi:5-methylthioadenosine/S-adenosylhomocysteine deaminase